MKGVQGTDESRAQLHRWMDERREELRLSWAEIARDMGMTEENLLRIRKGRVGISMKAERGIEDALGWERGSVEAAATRGVKPSPERVAAAAAASPRPVVWTREKEALFREVVRTLAEVGLEPTEETFQAMQDQYDRRMRQRETREENTQ